MHKIVSYLMLITLISAASSPAFAQSSNSGVVIASKRVVTDYTENYFVFGEVHNDLDYPVDVRVSLTLYDHSHKVLRTFLAATLVSHVRPGEIVPIQDYITNGNPEKYVNTVNCVCDIEDYSLDITWEKVEDKPARLSVEVTSYGVEGEYYQSYHIHGKVKNMDDDYAHNIVIGLSAYDSSGKLIFTDFGFTAGGYIKPGGTKDFDSMVDSFGLLETRDIDKIASLHAIVESDEYAMFRQGVDDKPTNTTSAIPSHVVGKDDEKEELPIILNDPLLESQSCQSQGTQMNISVKLRNLDDSISGFIQVIELRDDHNVTRQLSIQNVSLGVLPQEIWNFSVIATDHGLYEIRTFSVSNLTSPQVLSNVAYSPAYVQSC